MSTVRTNNLLRATSQVGSILLFAVAPAVAAFVFISATIGGPHPFYDFDGTLWQAGRAILHGHDPYPVRFLHRMAQVKQSGGSPSLVYAVPLYPAPTLLAFLPLSLLPLRVAGLIFALGSLAALFGGLRLLGVRDWRCWGAALLSWPALHSLRLGTLDPLLLLAIAVVWRTRRSTVASGVGVGFGATAKVFLWPVGVWLAATRRWRTVGVAVAAACLACLAGWAVISFDGLSSYPGMLSDVSSVEAAGGSSVVAAGVALGLSASLAHLLSYLATAVVLAIAWWVAWRERDEARALGLTVMAALLASPVVWAHYLLLVYVPIALLRPRLSVLWLLPLITYLAPVELTHGDFWLIAPYLLLELVVVVALWRPDLLRLRDPSECPAASVPAGAANQQGADGPTVRLPHGLRSTSFRSHTGGATAEERATWTPTTLGRRPEPGQ